MPENGPGEPTSPYHRQWNTTMSNGQQAQQPPPQHSFTMTATTTGSNGEARRQVQIVGTFLPNSNRHSNGRTPPVIHRQISNISMPNDKSGLFGSISNMVNSIVGAGMYVTLVERPSCATFVLNVWFRCKEKCALPWQTPLSNKFCVVLLVSFFCVVFSWW